MKTKPNYHPDFFENGIFHVYGRTNNKELLFRSDENRYYFLRQYAKYLYPFVDSFCWTLLPNHFHFLVRVKAMEEIKKYLHSQPVKSLKAAEKGYLAGNTTAEILLECEWKRLFNSYSMAFNKQYLRKGNLFHRPFRRVEVSKEKHFTQVIIYIHANAQRHKSCSDFTNYKWSSWHIMVSAQPTLLCRNEIIEWFGGLRSFIDTHKGMSEYYYNYENSIEDGE